MTGARISWREQKGMLPKDPMERLMVGASLASERAEPWLATIKPIVEGSSFRVISLSLDAYSRFSDAIVAGFSELSESLLARISNAERAAIIDEEAKRGNPPRLWSARENHLRLVVPERLLPVAKESIEQLFQSIPPIEQPT
jgi:hypothetical protein